MTQIHQGHPLPVAVVFFPFVFSPYCHYNFLWRLTHSGPNIQARPMSVALGPGDHKKEGGDENKKKNKAKAAFGDVMKVLDVLDGLLS